MLTMATPQSVPSGASPPQRSHRRFSQYGNGHTCRIALPWYMYNKLEAGDTIIIVGATMIPISAATMTDTHCPYMERL